MSILQTLGGDVVNYNTEPDEIYNVNEIEYTEGRPERFFKTSI
jgi:hypothetical protein